MTSSLEDGLIRNTVRTGRQPNKHTDSVLRDLMPDVPMTTDSPLTNYRRQASFDWRDLKLVVEGEEVIRFRNKIFRTLESDPIFKRRPDEELSRESKRELTFKRFKRLMEYDLLPDHEFMANPLLTQTLYSSLGQYDWSLSAKRFLAYEFVTVSLRGGGSSRHLAILDQLLDFKALGCFSLTELAHGSNTKAMGTRADFDSTTSDFVLNTPNQESIKVWSGNLGQTATHAVLFAQLYVNNQNHGLSAFIVPIRDPKTLLPYPGVTVGDMGPKIGLNGLDNGFVSFKNYRILKGSLMNRTGDINSSGDYVSEIKDRKRRVGITLGTLSMGRVGIVSVSVANMQTALTIGIRYSAARRQFGPLTSAPIEWPVIEYQMQQWRLFPYLAATYVLDIFCQSFLRDFLNFQVSVLFGTSSPELSELGQEIHAVACAVKPISGWLCRDAIQECREACGGHGFLAASRFGELRDDHDANNTYEGDNNVLQMQTSNYLIRKYQQSLLTTEKSKIIDPDSANGVESLDLLNPVEIEENPINNETPKPLRSQLGSIDVLQNARQNLKLVFEAKNIHQVQTMDFILESYQFLVSYLLFRSLDKLDSELINAQNDLFVARSKSQVYYCRSLSFAFMEHFILVRYKKFLVEEMDSNVSESIRNVLTRLGLLYGLWSLDAHAASLYEGGYYQGPEPNRLIRSAILDLCEQIKPDAVALVDAFAPPDFILNSILGQSDGKIYQNIFSMLNERSETFERPKWWREFTDNKPKIAALTPVEKAKL